MTITFTDVDRPTVTRQAKPNPFTELAGMLSRDRSITKAFTLALPAKAEDADNVIAEAKRQLSRAGNAVNVSLRSTVERAGSGNKATATFKVWAVDRIVKGTRKSAKANTGTPAE